MRAILLTAIFIFPARPEFPPWKTKISPQGEISPRLGTTDLGLIHYFISDLWFVQEHNILIQQFVYLLAFSVFLRQKCQVSCLHMNTTCKS